MKKRKDLIDSCVLAGGFVACFITGSAYGFIHGLYALAVVFIVLSLAVVGGFVASMIERRSYMKILKEAGVYPNAENGTAIGHIRPILFDLSAHDVTSSTYNNLHRIILNGTPVTINTWTGLSYFCTSVADLDIMWNVVFDAKYCSSESDYSAVDGCESDESDCTMIPYEPSVYRKLTVDDLVRIIVRKLDEGTITLDTKLFAHMYTEPGVAYEFNELCIDTVDGLDFDVDGKGIASDILRDSAATWVCPPASPDHGDVVLVHDANSDELYVAEYDEKHDLYLIYYGPIASRCTPLPSADVDRWMRIPPAQ